MTDTISLTGVVATIPRHITTDAGLTITSFRLASSQRRFDKTRQSWVDGGTNWYTVTAFRQLASNLAVSVHKGDHIVAAGRLRIREWENAERNGTTIEIEADAVGHDLSWGVRVLRKPLLLTWQPKVPYSLLKKTLKDPIVKRFGPLYRRSLI